MKLSNLFQLMEGREDVLFAKYEQKIEQQLAHNGEKVEARRAFDELFRAVGPKVADWAIRQYLKGQFRIEDAGRVNDDVMQYQKLSHRLPVEERDINKFDYRYIVNKLDELNKPELNTDAPDEDGVKVLYKGPYGFLCELLTKEAAMRLGKGTKWCTAADNDNRFDQYHAEGPLFFFRNTRGYKFQFHFEIGQFMDRRNEPIEVQELNRMVQSIPVIKKFFIQKLTTDNNTFSRLRKFEERYSDVVEKALPEIEGYFTKGKTDPTVHPFALAGFHGTFIDNGYQYGSEKERAEHYVKTFFDAVNHIPYHVNADDEFKRAREYMNNLPEHPDLVDVIKPYLSRMLFEATMSKYYMNQSGFKQEILNGIQRYVDTYHEQRNTHYIVNYYTNMCNLTDTTTLHKYGDRLTTHLMAMNKPDVSDIRRSISHFSKDNPSAKFWVTMNTVVANLETQPRLPVLAKKMSEMLQAGESIEQHLNTFRETYIKLVQRPSGPLLNIAARSLNIGSMLRYIHPETMIIFEVFYDLAGMGIGRDVKALYKKRPEAVEFAINNIGPEVWQMMKEKHERYKDLNDVTDIIDLLK